MNLQFPEIFLPLIQEKKRYKAYWGGRGAGKSENFARALLYLAINKKIRILCTREIQNSIKDSVHKLLSDVIEAYFPSFFVVTRDEIKAINGSLFIFKGLRSNPREIKSTTAINYCWVEEAQGISKESLDILIPTIREPESEIWFSYNRYAINDPVHIFMENTNEEERVFIKINYYDNPFLPEVLQNEASREKQINYQDYLHIWEGEPQIQGERCVLDRISIKQAMNRKVSKSGAWIMGVDVARFGGDRTCLIFRQGLQMIDYRVHVKFDTTEVRDAVVRFADKYNLNKNEFYINIDDGGLNGVSDQLLERGYQVNRILFGSSARDSKKYKNRITELWFNFRDNLDKYGLLDIPDLLEELSTREYKFTLAGQRQVESKDDWKKRLKISKSSDIADACLLAFDEPGFGIRARII